MNAIDISTSRHPKVSVVSAPACEKCGASENLIKITYEGDGVYLRTCTICSKTAYSFPRKQAAPKIVRRIMTKKYTLYCACGVVEEGHTIRAKLCKICRETKRKADYVAWYDANIRINPRPVEVNP